ncbi:MAG TPA: DUF3465 domain-containing protein [Chthoniobacterales bacterium]
MKKLLLACVLIAAASAALSRFDFRDGAGFRSGAGNERALVEAIERQKSDVLVRGQGVVARILPDDNNGSRHQRFILRLPTGQTVLIAHNIDIAPKIPSLRSGDTVSFQGEYEWNPKGGVVHWTHHDPDGRHPDGWLKHGGQVFR